MNTKISISLLAAVLALPAASDHFFTPGKIRVLILSGRNNHDWRSTTPRLRQILEETGRFDVRVTEEPAGLTAQTLEPYHVLVSDYNGPRWGAAAEQAVEQFTGSGKGFVATHAASYAFGDMEILGDRHVKTGLREAPWQAYGEMIGARWSIVSPRSGHGKRHVFRVQWTDRTHSIATGAIASAMDDSFGISDELYHNLRLQPSARVIATAYDAPEMDGTGKHEPIAWTTQFGQGRVFFTALGHDVAAMTAPGFTAMFASAVVWAAGAVNKPADSERQPVRVTLVTGGHDHAPSFYSVFEGQSELSVRVNPHPLAYEGDLRKNCDVLVLYDMISDPGVKQKQNLREFLESGKGLVVLHHALVNFNSWEWWWREVAGARYLQKPEGASPASTFLHDAAIETKTVLPHPVTSGIPPMLIHDETYKQMWISPKVEVLLRTNHPASDGPVAWISPFEKSRVVVIQLGHGPEAHRHPGYRQLVRNAILWSAGRRD